MAVERFAAAGLMAASLLLAHGAAPAQQPPAATLATCTACHGPGGNSQLPLTPSIAGQPRVFIENQLVVIREGLREVPAMKDVLSGMSDETIIALAKHFAAQPPTPKAVARDATKALQGAEIASALLCGTCHLGDYTGQNQVPRLAGQDEAFLVHSMKQFRDNPGPGRDTIMAATLRGLSDTDLANLAHYFSTFRAK
jgi:cytochrome c553